MVNRLCNFNIWITGRNRSVCNILVHLLLYDKGYMFFRHRLHAPVCLLLFRTNSTKKSAIKCNNCNKLIWFCFDENNDKMCVLTFHKLDLIKSSIFNSFVSLLKPLSRRTRASSILTPTWWPISANLREKTRILYHYIGFFSKRVQQMHMKLKLKVWIILTIIT